MRILCTDHECKYCADTGYYGVCKKRSDDNLSYGGITRMLVETCQESTNKKGDKDNE